MAGNPTIGPYSGADLDRLQDALDVLFTLTRSDDPPAATPKPLADVLNPFLAEPFGMGLVLGETARACARYLPRKARPDAVVSPRMYHRATGKIAAGPEVEQTPAVWVGRLIVAAFEDDKDGAGAMTGVILQRGPQFAFGVLTGLLGYYRGIARVTGDPFRSGLVECACPRCEARRGR